MIENRLAASKKQREAFMAFVARHGLKLSSWARDAGLNNANALYNYKSGTSDFLAPDTLDLLVKAVPGATFGEILGEAVERTANLRLLPCRTVARAGLWRATYDHPGMSRDLEFPLMDGLSADELVRLEDDHVDKIYPGGSYLAVQSIESMARPLRAADKVLVHRIRAGKHEVTVRELVADGAGMSMVYRSSDPRHGSAINVPTPYDGGLWEVDGDRYRIRGRVVMQTWLEDKPGSGSV